jgi:hypothetical protein
MGYLAVLFFTFVAGLVINAMALGLLSQYLFGGVQEWVLFAALFVAGLGAWAAGDTYDNRR